LRIYRIQAFLPCKPPFHGRPADGKTATTFLWVQSPSVQILSFRIIGIHQSNSVAESFGMGINHNARYAERIT